MNCFLEQAVWEELEQIGDGWIWGQGAAGPGGPGRGPGDGWLQTVMEEPVGQLPPLDLGECSGSEDS